MVTISNWAPKDDRKQLYCRNAKDYAPHIRVCFASSPASYPNGEAVPFLIRVYIKQKLASEFKNLKMEFKGYFDDGEGGEYHGEGSLTERRKDGIVKCFDVSFKERGIPGLMQLLLIDGSSHIWWATFPDGSGKQIVDRVRLNYYKVCTASLVFIPDVLVRMVIEYLFGDKPKLKQKQ